MTPPTPLRFTLDGSDALEAHLSRICDDVHLGVSTVIPPQRLQAILLGGGYGRGEGGVLRTTDGDAPYNDLEFYVFTTGSALLGERRFRHRLHELGERLSTHAGLEVEFKVLTLRKLRSSQPSMFYYDLVLGHRWIAGDDVLLQGCEHHRDPTRIPLHEATRLLMNRCSGLLFSLERLARPLFAEADADFVGRNIAKARLAFGDVFLAAHGQYHWSCRERHQRLIALANQLSAKPDPTAPAAPVPPPLNSSSALEVTDLVRHHAAGIDFKLNPVRTSLTRDELVAQHQELSQLGCRLWLWLEQRRLGVSFESTAAYALSPLNKCPETSAVRNGLINARLHGLQIPLCSKGIRYPRERLLNSLPLLLWHYSPNPEATLRRRLEWELRTRAKDFPGWIAAYRRLWNRFN